MAAGRGAHQKKAAGRGVKAGGAADGPAGRDPDLPPGRGRRPRLPLRRGGGRGRGPALAAAFRAGFARSWARVPPADRHRLLADWRGPTRPVAACAPGLAGRPSPLIQLVPGPAGPAGLAGCGSVLSFPLALAACPARLGGEVFALAKAYRLATGRHWRLVLSAIEGPLAAWGTAAQGTSRPSRPRRSSTGWRPACGNPLARLAAWAGAAGRRGGAVTAPGRTEAAPRRTACPGRGPPCPRYRFWRQHAPAPCGEGRPASACPPWCRGQHLPVSPVEKTSAPNASTQWHFGEANQRAVE